MGGLLKAGWPLAKKATTQADDATGEQRMGNINKMSGGVRKKAIARPPGGMPTLPTEPTDC